MCCPAAVSTFLLEIGTEELPADFARLALPQLEQLVRSLDFELIGFHRAHNRIITITITITREKRWTFGLIPSG